MRIGARVGSSGTVIPTYIQGDQVASSVATTSSSNVSKSRRHYAYGRSRSGAVDTAYGYTSQLQDSATGLYYYNARYYDSRIGYFISPDSIVPDPSNLLDYNRYAYARGNPLKYNDPTGHWIESAVDIGFIGYDLYDIRQNGLNWENGLSLAADVGGLILPIFTGGGMIVRGVNRADDAVDAARAASNVGDAAKLADTWQYAKNYRQNYVDFYNVSRDAKFQVHHVLPQKFADTLANVGINIHDPHWLREVQIVDGVTGELTHQRLYTRVWEQWTSELGHVPTADEIVTFAKQLEAEYATEGTLFYRQGDNIPGVVDWSKLPSELQ
jgi:RHS repeat-associated protein